MFARFKFSPRTSRSWAFRFCAAPSLLRFARSRYAPTAARNCPSPVYIVGVGFHGLRTDDLVVASLRRPPSVRQAFLLEEVERVRSAGVSNPPDPVHRVEAPEVVVMPIERIMEARELGVNNSRIRSPLEKPSAQKDFARPFNRLVYRDGSVVPRVRRQAKHG